MGGNDFEEGRGRGASQIRFERIQGLLIQPALDHVLQVGRRVQRDHAITQRPRSRFNGGVDDPGEDMLHGEGSEATSPTPSLTLPRKRGRGGSFFLCDGEGLIKAQHFCGVRIALGEFRGALTAERPRVHSDGGFKDLHQIFSRFTRKALNSGVYALASPTNGVSELASQFAPFFGSASAETPTKPQWIGMPT